MSDAAPASSWPDVLEPVVDRVAAASVPLLLQPQYWINRKVETIEFVDDRRVRRHVSVDFTWPELGGPLTLASGRSIAFVPLVQLRKQVLRNFDIVDEAGAAVPILTAEQNGRIARRLLGQLAEEALDTTEPVKRVLDCLDKVVGTEREARAALMELKAAAVKTPPDRELAKLWEHPIAQPLMQDLAEHFILFAVLDAQAGDRRVLKFVYDGELTWESEAAGESLDRWRKRVEERVGLGPVVLRIAVPGVGATHSYHAEVPAPEDLVITRARLLDVNSKELSDDRTPDRAHLWTTSSKREQEGRIVLELRVGARGLYGAAVWISLLTTLLFGAGLVFRLASVHTRAGAAAAIVVVLPALFASYLARPGEHPLVQRLVSGLRAMITALAALSFAAAAVLAVEVHFWFRLLVWIVAFLASATMSSVIVYGYWRSHQHVPEPQTATVTSSG